MKLSLTLFAILLFLGFTDSLAQSKSEIIKEIRSALFKRSKVYTPKGMHQYVTNYSLDDCQFSFRCYEEPAGVGESGYNYKSVGRRRFTMDLSKISSVEMVKTGFGYKGILFTTINDEVVIKTDTEVGLADDKGIEMVSECVMPLDNEEVMSLLKQLVSLCSKEN